ncbi:MAG: phage tail family protein [Oscillospiraceae bacterium]
MAINTFSYGGVDSSVFNITCDTEIHPILPPQRKYVTVVPGLDGYVDQGIGGYEARAIPVKLSYQGSYSELRENEEKIIAWLSNSSGEYKRLVFNNNPNKYYLAKVYSNLDLTNTSNGNIGTVLFECNPPWQFENGVLQTPDEITWNTQDYLNGNQWGKKFTASGSLRLANTGAMPVKPIIKLYGYIPSGLLLTCGTQQWQFNSFLPYDGIVIDCANETVKQVSNGANLYSFVNPAKKDYFTLQTGKVEIGLTASGLGAFPYSLNMIIEFNQMR